MAGTHEGPASQKSKTTDLTRQEKAMYMHPEISKQLADERRRDMLTDAQNDRLARQARTAPHRQPLTYRLWRRLRPVTRPRLEPQV
jgi:hypothetical protein